MSRHGRRGRNPHQHPHLPVRPARPGAPAAERLRAKVDGRVITPVDGEPPPPVHAGPAQGVPEPPDAVGVQPRVAVEPGFPPVPEIVHGALEVTASDGLRDSSRSGPDRFRSTCTQAQLRRFIKSRPWIPMHELRRRFGIDGADDDVSLIRVGNRILFIGLPSAEGRMVGELLSAGDVGCELSLDPDAPIVVGVYPMRPIPRS